MSVWKAARTLCNRDAAVVAAGLTAATSLSGCASPLSELGLNGMDATEQTQFAAICHSTTNPNTVVYRDRSNGNTFIVHVQDMRRAYVEASIEQGGFHFSGSLDGGANGSPGTGVHLNGGTTYGDYVQVPTPAVQKNMIWRAADRGITDIQYSQIIPGRPCELIDNNWRHNYLFPAGG